VLNHRFLLNAEASGICSLFFMAESATALPPFALRGEYWRHNRAWGIGWVEI